MSVSRRCVFRSAAVLLPFLLFAGALAAGAEGDSLAERVQRVCAEEPAKVTAEFCSMKAASIELVKADGSRIAVDVLIADNDALRTAGYQFIDGDVVRETAIFFVFEAPTSAGFHMCNVRVPLDIVWFRANGTILDALTMFPGRVGNALLCPDIYRPRRFGTYLFALELPQGTLDRLGLSPLSDWRLDLAP